MGTDSAQSAVKNFLGRVPTFFGSKSSISRFGERFRDGQYTVWSVSSLLCFSTHSSHRAQPFVKVGACAPVPHGVGATG